jgi:hypothetical protein
MPSNFLIAFEYVSDGSNWTQKVFVGARSANFIFTGVYTL